MSGYKRYYIILIYHVGIYSSYNLIFPVNYGVNAVSTEYYARLQEACDAGAFPEYLTPEGAVGLKEIMNDYYGGEARIASLTPIE